MSTTPLELAGPKIIQALRENSTGVFRQRDLVGLLEMNRQRWGLPASLGFSSFLEYLTSNSILERVGLALPHRAETLYLLGQVPLLVVALAAKPRSYLSHFTALTIHELTEQVSKTIYVNVEQRPQPSNPASLTQESIDRAFRNAQRRTTNIAEYAGHRLMYLNGKHTGQLGVIEHRLTSGERVQATDLERTLIDIAVRPGYSGGVATVADAYRAAHDRVAVERLSSLLHKIDFVYPYEQAIGFYLERAGIRTELLKPFRKRRFRFDFYLAHGMRETDYVAEWRLFIPRGL